jgi:hypothetical protein
MTSRTIFLSRLFGFYSILVSLAMMLHRQTTVETIQGFMHDPPLLFLAGIMAVALGLAMVLGHNVWSGGALPVVVTLIGWVTLAKGVSLIFLTPDAASNFYMEQLQYGRLFYLYTAIPLVLGIYLVVAAGRQSAA